MQGLSLPALAVTPLVPSGPVAGDTHTDLHINRGCFLSDAQFPSKYF